MMKKLNFAFIQVQLQCFLYSDGKNTVRQVDFTLNETHIRFTKELWSRYSDIVLAKHLALFDDWLLGISTPNSDKTTLACFA